MNLFSKWWPYWLSCCSSNWPDMVLSHGLCISCYLCLECLLLPIMCMAYFLTSITFLPKCHFFSESFAVSSALKVPLMSALPALSFRYSSHHFHSRWLTSFSPIAFLTLLEEAPRDICQFCLLMNPDYLHSTGCIANTHLIFIE